MAEPESQILTGPRGPSRREDLLPGLLELRDHGDVPFCPLLSATFPVPLQGSLHGQVKLGAATHFIPCLMAFCAFWHGSEKRCGFGSTPMVGPT